MKTLIPGKLPEEIKAWWVDSAVRCPKCGAEYLLEKDDDLKNLVNVITERRLDGKSTATILCITPECFTSFSITR